MINVSDARFSKSSYDFEECTAIEIDSWSNSSSFVSSPNSSMESVTSTTNNNNSNNNNKDESIITLFAQSIEIFGSSISPWPTAAASSKSLPEQVAGIFITSETTAAKDESVQSRLESNKPQIQSKLRRSTSTARRLSLSKINEESIFDAQKLYNELEPIPIISSEEKKTSKALGFKPSASSSFSAANAAEVTMFESPRKASRLQNWLSALYSRTGNQSTNPNKSTADEESSPVKNAPQIKGILKKSSGAKNNAVQRSVSIPESEAKKMTVQSAPASPQRPKKTMKLRFDNEVSVCETFHKEDYSRQSLDYVARQLTPSLALAIKKELNSVKQEMEVHEESRHLTQFYLIK